SCEFSNFKNSLKSRGSWIVAIVDLAQELEILHPLMWRARQPILPVAVLIFEPIYSECVAIHAQSIDVHGLSIALNTPPAISPKSSRAPPAAPASPPSPS